MSIERDVITVKADGSTATVPASTEIKELSRAEKKARLVQVLDRGIINDRLAVDLPPNIVGVWARHDLLEIDRLRQIGYEVDTQYAGKRAVHNDGTTGAIVGDLIFMTTSRENAELIDEIRLDQFNRMNAKGKTQQEEKDFTNLAHKELVGSGVTPLVESSATAARRAEIENALGVKK